MPRTECTTTTDRRGRLARASVAAWLGLLTLMGGVPTTLAAEDGVTLEARVLLDGHVRQASWMAIEVRVRNDGPAVAGELRLTGGMAGRTSFGTLVDLPTQSAKVYRMYAQPPGFGRTLEITLVEDSTAIARVEVAFTSHDATQMIAGVVAERPGAIIGSLDLLPNQQNLAPLIIPLDLAELPRRVESWATLDRLIWQDTDASALEPEQLAALRGWIAGGGRLVIVGGTTGPDSLAGFPDDVLPYRPVTTTDVAPAALLGLLGELPEGATDLPTMSGSMIDGRALARSGDQVIAAERSYGSGAVTLLGFDPTTEWIRGSDLVDGLWRRLLPPRAAGGPIVTDDSQLVSAVSQLPELALPPIGSLVAVLGVYILLIGPINYLVLRRLDRRDWAWITMPVMVVVFTAGSYGYGALIRGSELIVNEIAIVRGSPGATEGTAQVYLGVFSPSRGTYQLEVPGGALLSSPTSADFFGDEGQPATLDVIQGDVAAIRDLTVGFGSLRTIRAEAAVAVPLIQASLRVEDGRLRGTVTNASDVSFLSPAIVLGGTVATLDDLAPGAQAEVDIAIAPLQIGQPLADRIVGSMFFPEQGQQVTDDAARKYARYAVINQLTYDPNWGHTGRLPTEGAVLLGWSDGTLLDLTIEGQEAPRRTGNTLFFMPTRLAVAGSATFSSDLIRSTLIEADAGFFSKEPMSMSFGKGSVELAYRPIPFDGVFEPSELVMTMGFGGEPGFGGATTPVEPLDEVPEPCPDPPTQACLVNIGDGMPEVELFDLQASEWRRFPHLAAGTRYAIADPDRYIDPASGTVLARFINEVAEHMGFAADVTMRGVVR